jgi:hypothetical protein
LIDALAMTRRINPQVRQNRHTRVEALVVAALIAGLAAAVLLAAALLAVPLWSTLAAKLAPALSP